MERSSEYGDLAAALAEARPTPREGFAKELDERVAAGFPRRSRFNRTPLSVFANRLSGFSPQRLIFAAGTGVLATIAIATVIVASQSPSSRHPVRDGQALLPNWRGVQFEPPPPATEESAQRSTPLRSGTALPSRSAAHASPASGAAETSGRAHRDIERSAEIGLLADPADVADDSAAVFTAVHDAHGIVLRSTTTSGKRAGATFELLIPSARLGDALAAFSAIDEVGSRHEATEDITAPTVSASEKLRDSRARIDGLLTQLAAAETETEMASIEAKLDRERHHASRLRTQLDKLEQRTEFSRVSVRIKTAASSTDSGGSWGIDDAFGDAGHILGIAAGVTLIGLAVLAPLALIVLLAWLTHRIWVRAQRRRALRDA
jgi:hypothetical protein